ncbi:MAG TPA: hypothetical protein VFY99_04890 [Solirubrobacterales bacterium]
MPETLVQVEVLPEKDRTPVAPDGAVQSTQAATATLPASVLAELWRREYLERLARAYWAYLSKVSLGLIRVVYAPDSRTVVLLTRRLPLLRFHAPEYEAEPEEGSVTWRIDRGLLVAHEGRGQGFLRIEVRKLEEPGRLHLSVSVQNFYPFIRGRGRFARFGAWLYGQTQVRIHRLVTYGFLRSLARLDLPPLRIGSLRAEIEAPGGAG